MVKRKRPKKRKQKKWPKPLYCSDCNGWRPHTMTNRVTALGSVQKFILCGVCEGESLHPGIQCGRCGESRFKTLYVRHPRPGLTIRVRECRGPKIVVDGAAFRVVAGVCGQRLRESARVAGSR